MWRISLISLMQIDVERIKQRLFASRAVRAEICRDYGIDAEPASADALATAVFAKLEQAPAPRPLEQSFTNGQVFRAAVRALGSNSRKWALFLKNERRLTDLLGEYDPVYAHRATQGGTLGVDRIKALLPGQSSSGDASAILRWAQLLAETENYYAFIHDLGAAFREMSQQVMGESVADTDLLLCLVGYLGDPPSQWRGSAYLSDASRHVGPARHKTPGMQYILASEFLRNLGWNGFKRDRHVQRLLSRWLPHGSGIVDSRVDGLRSLIGRSGGSLITYLTYSLIGNSAVPSGLAISQVDNLVWLLGVYVEKKGYESDHVYLIPAPG